MIKWIGYGIMPLQILRPYPNTYSEGLDKVMEVL
jgi:hypothetical protein